MPDFGSEVMAEALAQRALVKPVYTIPIIPLSSSNQHRHQDPLDMKDYKKVSRCGFQLPWERIMHRAQELLSTLQCPSLSMTEEERPAHFARHRSDLDVCLLSGAKKNGCCKFCS